MWDVAKPEHGRIAEIQNNLDMWQSFKHIISLTECFVWYVCDILCYIHVPIMSLCLYLTLTEFSSTGSLHSLSGFQAVSEHPLATTRTKKQCPKSADPSLEC